MKVGDKTFKVHLDGYNMLPLLTGETKEDPRKEFFYFNDDAELVGLRYDNWKIVFEEQQAQGTMKIWSTPFVTLRVPKIFNLRTDPIERAITGQFIGTFKEFPPSQKAGSFSLGDALDKLTVGASGSK